MEIKELTKLGRQSGSTTAITKILQDLLYNWDVKVLVVNNTQHTQKEYRKNLGEYGNKVEFAFHNNLNNSLMGKYYDIIIVTDYSMIADPWKVVETIRVYGRTKYLLLEKSTAPRDCKINYEIYN